MGYAEHHYGEWRLVPGGSEVSVSKGLPSVNGKRPPVCGNTGGGKYDEASIASICDALDEPLDGAGAHAQFFVHREVPLYERLDPVRKGNNPTL